MGLARYCVVVVCCAGLAGCGTETLEMAKVERDIAKGVEEKTATENVEIDCPDDVEVKKGDVFECRLTAAGELKAAVKVTQVDDDGKLDWELNP